jgi:hypothetical protein
MVLKWYGIDAGIQRCKTTAGNRWLEYGDVKVGMTMPSGIKDCLESFGLPARIFKGSVSDIVRYVDMNRPLILLVRSSVKTWHWLVAIGYYENGSRIRLSDPSGRAWTINRGTLEGAWTFSTDLEGQATGGRRCTPCGGSGKLASSRIPCTNCAGTGKMISNLQVKKCSKCDGAGKINVSGGQCLVCSGSGNSPDMFRKAVETARVTGFTMIVPDRGPRQITKVSYTIKNDSGRTVRFVMQPSGKSYELEAGKTFTGTSNDVDGKAPTIKVTDSGKIYNLVPGNHKFWWMSKENRIGFDLNVK